MRSSVMMSPVPGPAAMSCLCLGPASLSGFLAHNGLTWCLATSEEIVSQQQMSRIPSFCKQSVVSVSELQVCTQYVAIFPG